MFHRVWSEYVFVCPSGEPLCLNATEGNNANQATLCWPFSIPFHPFSRFDLDLTISLHHATFFRFVLLQMRWSRASQWCPIVLDALGMYPLYSQHYYSPTPSASRLFAHPCWCRADLGICDRHMAKSGRFWACYSLGHCYGVTLGLEMELCFLYLTCPSKLLQNHLVSLQCSWGILD